MPRKKQVKSWVVGVGEPVAEQSQSIPAAPAPVLRDVCNSFVSVLSAASNTHAHSRDVAEVKHFLRRILLRVEQTPRVVVPLTTGGVIVTIEGMEDSIEGRQK